VRVTATVGTDASGSIANVATVWGNEGDPDESNNTARSTIQVVPTSQQSPPILSDLSAVRRCVRAAALGQPKADSHGLAFSFTLSESADVTFTVMHHVESPAWTSCPETERDHGHKPGTYRIVGQGSHPVPAGHQTVSIGSAARAGHVQALGPFAAGQHRVNLARIANNRLSPGTYVLFAKAVSSSGQTSRLSVVKFWVVR
jgi:hypothetical protein